MTQPQLRYEFDPIHAGGTVVRGTDQGRSATVTDPATERFSALATLLRGKAASGLHVVLRWLAEIRLSTRSRWELADYMRHEWQGETSLR